MPDIVEAAARPPTCVPVHRDPPRYIPRRSLVGVPAAVGDPSGDDPGRRSVAGRVARPRPSPIFPRRSCCRGVTLAIGQRRVSALVAGRDWKRADMTHHRRDRVLGRGDAEATCRRRGTRRGPGLERGARHAGRVVGRRADRRRHLRRRRDDRGDDRRRRALASRDEDSAHREGPAEGWRTKDVAPSAVRCPRRRVPLPRASTGSWPSPSRSSMPTVERPGSTSAQRSTRPSRCRPSSRWKTRSPGSRRTAAPASRASLWFVLRRHAEHRCESP